LWGDEYVPVVPKFLELDNIFINETKREVVKK